ncbi:MAG: hypothetical protein FVQ85_10670 [Planctomycetes bacterium]|nr:hypothetical protein [Planctomycetota bacterium]
MKEVIIIAGRNKVDVGWIRCCLEQQGHSSILCKTPKELVEKLKVFPACSVHVRLVIIDHGMWENINNDLIVEMSECVPYVPFVLLDKNNITFLVEDWLTGSMQHLTVSGSELPEHVFRSRCSKFLGSVEDALLDLENGITNAQNIQTISYTMNKIATLAAQMIKPNIKALAVKTMDLLEDIQHNQQCVVSEAHKESLFNSIDEMKECFCQAEVNVA